MTATSLHISAPDPSVDNHSQTQTAMEAKPQDTKPAQELSATTQTTAPTDKKSEPTFGEKKFNDRYYGTVGFWANLSLSSLITYYVNENSKGHGMKTFLNEKFYKNTLGIKYHGMRDVLTKATTLLMGGHITAIAIYIAEKFKSSQVRKWDEEHYGPNAEADPAIKAAHERIDNESKINKIGMAISRMLCWGVIQGVAAVGGDKDKNFIKGLAEKRGVKNTEFFSVERPSEWVGTKIAHYTPGFLKKPATSVLGLIADKDKKHEVYQKVMEYAAMDTIYTALTAWMLKPLTQFLVDNVPFFRKKNNNENQNIGKKHVMISGYVGTSNAQDIPQATPDKSSFSSNHMGDIAAKDAAIKPDTHTLSREYLAPVIHKTEMTHPLETRTA